MAPCKPPSKKPQTLGIIDLSTLTSAAHTKTPLLLLILDGWGHSENPRHNAINAANTPTWDRLWREQPKTLLHCSGTRVGLPEGQMGNSEVGHMTIGAGRVIYQNYSRINRAIDDGSFYDNPAYVEAVDKAVSAGKAVHIMGLLSPGGVHSHEEHIVAILKLAAQRGADKLFLHAFLDGRDTPPRSARASIEKVEETLGELGVGRLASISGRYYAMDRDQRWERVQLAWQAVAEGEAEHRAATALDALDAAYARGENDEFVVPTIIADESQQVARIDDGDSVIFMNFRPDRARQLSRAFVDKGFEQFPQSQRPDLAAFVMTTEYADNIQALCAFGPEPIKQSLGEYLANSGKTQLRIAETEKYAHVTFFFSAGREETFAGEDRILIPSPQVATYDLQPEMSAYEVTESLVKAIKSGDYDAIICNFANGDMVGHTGVYDAAVKAAEVIDHCLGEILTALGEVGGQCLISADHGNIEKMRDTDTDEVLTSHTVDPVPLVYFGPRRLSLAENGSLADIAPTMLALLDLPIPREMTGHSLLEAN
ncbi:MAG TPA: 2,3-bisphosphoglycerate-independent phosphoglycerate mutase [Porticoccaceae bacterium]|nr:2,3-bisphosphoglycerate-independent phosphoglycerate mutase [Porticoccaceae bacterium]HCO60548.1 2,3-bisphosphoglycerate-independent phosphoglycerate mutase [Porticoccaceae bacterium]